MKHGVLEVPGAMLYYEVRGSGPVLLMIHGGNGDAESYPITDRLSDRYTVVTYDRRGHSRSRLEDPNENYQVSAHSDDASRLLAALTDEPAYVFGCSSGAVIGLDLAVRHPEQIRMLVAHEPPIPQLLAGSDRAKGFESLENLEKQYKRSGLQALEAFAIAMGITSSAQPERPTSRTEQFMANIDYFILSEVPGLREYTPTSADLKLHRLRSYLPAALIRKAVSRTGMQKHWLVIWERKWSIFQAIMWDAFYTRRNLPKGWTWFLEGLTTKIPRDETLGIFNQSAVHRKRMACNRHSIFQFNCIRSLML
ncbi:alpha/beta hydrolase [Bacillus haynesii]|uniref:alpha/beta fold hydrolase n=1 Tax=Bacillus haynesii TaxID=1925021 RepID=UPI00227EE6C7|nr:alpha/beta hydrolase [Bacillus haynesii]MCY9336841.1 alpha/beta hydrolase [Bacillus haynesii]